MANKLEIAGIIQRMEAAGEPEENIRAVVAAWDREQAQALPTPAAEPKEPAWYNVPGKIEKTQRDVAGKIKREAELTAIGKQTPVVGGALSAGYMLQGGLRGIADVLSPLWTNPASRAIGEGLAYTGRDNPVNLARDNPQLRSAEVAPTPEYLKRGAEYFRANPEVGNRIGLGVDLASLVPVGAAAKAAKVGENTIVPTFEQAAKEQTGKALTEIKQIRNAKPKVKPPMFSGIEKGEATVLSVPKSKLSDSFEVYAKQAEKAKNLVDEVTGEAVETPIDLVAKKGPVAHDVLLKQRQAVGAVKDDAMKTIDDAVVSTNDFVDSKALKTSFNNNLEKYAGAYVDEKGMIKPSASGYKAQSLLPDIKKLNEIVEGVPAEMTISQLDNLSANLRTFLSQRTAGQLAPKKDAIDGIVGNLRTEINKQIENKASKLLTPDDYKRYMDAKKEYAVLSDLTDETSKLFGREVVPGSDITSRGASIVKRAVQSNADAGSKALFNEIKNRTGIDFIQEGNYAVIAMKAAGDPRARSLLEDMGLITGVATGGTHGIMMAGVNLAKKGAEKAIQGNKLDKLVQYYGKAQGRKLSDIGRK